MAEQKIKPVQPVSRPPDPVKKRKRKESYKRAKVPPRPRDKTDKRIIDTYA